MLVHRLGQKKFIRDLSGEGARLQGGRWNKKGTRVLYTSEHCSLALLELLVNTPKELFPQNIFYLKLTIPDTLEVLTIEKEDLPDNWKQYPAPQVLAQKGSKWQDEMESAVLKVPSVIIPGECNVLLNPRHPQFQQCEIKGVLKFELDFRVDKHSSSSGN